MALYLVTGAAGFIGSSLVRALLQRGERVRGIDNFSSGKPENISGLRSQMDFREADLLEAAALQSACRGVDFILHQAALPSVPRSVSDPLASHAANLNGTLNLLMAARDARVKRVVYAASSSAYGETPTLPKKEEMQPQPISPYAVQKLAGEFYMTSFYRVYGLDTVSLRYFNVFGPYQDMNSQYSGVLAKFCMKMLRGEKPSIYGDGEQSRDFTYIDNTVAANLLAATAASAGVSGRVFNVACGQRITLNEAVKHLRKMTGYSGEIGYEPERTGDVRHSLADISHAERSLGYRPSVSFEDGLRRTVDWYRQRMQSEVNSESIPSVAG